MYQQNGGDQDKLLRGLEINEDEVDMLGGLLMMGLGERREEMKTGEEQLEINGT